MKKISRVLFDYDVYPKLVSSLQTSIQKLVGKRLDILDISDVEAGQNKG